MLTGVYTALITPFKKDQSVDFAALEKILLENIDRKSDIVEEKLDRKIAENEIHFSSTRGGAVNFGHTIGFDSVADCIEIKHTARSRDGYALGAVKCAEWLTKQSPGFYSMEDYLRDVKIL